MKGEEREGKWGKSNRKKILNQKKGRRRKKATKKKLIYGIIIIRGSTSGRNRTMDDSWLAIGFFIFFCLFSSSFSPLLFFPFFKIWFRFLFFCFSPPRPSFLLLSLFLDPIPIFLFVVLFSSPSSPLFLFLYF